MPDVSFILPDNTMSETTGISDQDSSKVAGNASQGAKEHVAEFLHTLTNGQNFAHSVGRRLLLREVSFLEKVEEPKRMESRVVLELIVDEGKLLGACMWR